MVGYHRDTLSANGMVSKWYYICQWYGAIVIINLSMVWCHSDTLLYPRSQKGRGYTVLPLSIRSSVQDIFHRIFLSNCWRQKSDIWSQASYRYTILWVAFLDPSDSYFLFADLVGFYTHWTYMHIFLSNYWWQRSDIWSQASYRYPISWEAFFDPSITQNIWWGKNDQHNKI